MASYLFKFKKSRSLFWKKRVVIGHKFTLDTDRMTFYYPNGIEEIAQWSQYNCVLGSDFMLATKESMEKEANIKVNTIVRG